MPVRAEFLSELLRHGDIGWSLLGTGLVVAFVLGAMHALSPGHGKTIVAAYLVGSRGTVRHALFLGAMVTFTHTVSVFGLGLATLFLSRQVSPDKIFPVLGAISGLTIVWIGATLLYQRARSWKAAQRAHHHHHHHHHDHHHDHHHHHHPHNHYHEDHAHAHGHDHSHAGGHSHIPEGEVTLASLIALGASGGLVPCPSALVLLLSSIALRRVGLGLILLIAFSAGLALVLMAIGVIVIYAKHLLPEGGDRPVPAPLRLLTVFSAAVIVGIGLFMTAVSLGVIRPGFAVS